MLQFDPILPRKPRGDEVDGNLHGNQQFLCTADHTERWTFTEYGGLTDESERSR